MKHRLDHLVAAKGLAPTRSQAESWIKLGKVTVDGKVVTKPGFFVDEAAEIKLLATERYVSRAGLKLASVADKFGIDFTGTTVLDVGSSTGGFTDYALQHGAARVYAVDVGTDQLHPSLRSDPRIELHEKTNILDIHCSSTETSNTPNPDLLNSKFQILHSDIILIDVSFVSLRQLLPHIATLVRPGGTIYAMVKPQFEATRQQITSSGVIKNDTVRRTILKDFEAWARPTFSIVAKADSDVRGARGNAERFYALRPRS